MKQVGADLLTLINRVITGDASPLTQLPGGTDLTVWTPSNAVVTPNVAIAFDGSNTADKLSENSAFSGNHFISQAVTKTAPIPQSFIFRIEAKSSERQRIKVSFTNASGLNGNFLIADLTGAQIGVPLTVIGAGFTDVAATVRALSFGWCLIELKAMTGAGNGVIVRIDLDAAVGTNAEFTNYPGTAGFGVFLNNPVLFFADDIEPPEMHDFDCYTLSLLNGSVLRFTTADFDITDGTNTWAHDLVAVDEKTSRVTAHWKQGFDVDNWIVVMMPRPTDVMTGAAFPDKINGIPWLQAAQGGSLDGAELIVDRAYFNGIPTWPIAPGGAVPVGFASQIFAGLVRAADTNSLVCVLTAADYRVLLDIQVPIHVFTGGCRYTLFDVGCTLNPNDFDTAGTAIGGSTPATIANALPVPPGSGTYLQGKIVMTSGFNAGFSRLITSWSGPSTAFGLLIPFPFPIVAGDTFLAYPGCAKTQAACVLFGNLPNFGGQSYIPAPEAAV